MIGSRSAWSAAVALALLPVPVAGFLLLRPDRTPEPAAPTASPSERTASPNPRPQRPPRLLLDRSALVAAHQTARRFAAQYARYVGGRVRTREIADAAPELIRELGRHPPRITPAQQHHGPMLRGVSAEPAAVTVRAVAILQDAGGPPYRLAFCLERRGPRWPVTRLLDA
jgi:hypothetical protein